MLLPTPTARPANFADLSFFFTDSFLNLTGVYAVEGRALAIHVENRGKEGGRPCAVMQYTDLCKPRV